MGARSYAPDLGVWTSAEPIAVDQPTQGIGAHFAANNPYAYAGDSPVVAVDRTGRFPFFLLAAILIGSLVTPQYANAPESRVTPLYHKGVTEIVGDTFRNAATIYAAGTSGAAAVKTIATEGATLGILRIASSGATGTVAAVGLHQSPIRQTRAEGSPKLPTSCCWRNPCSQQARGPDADRRDNAHARRLAARPEEKRGCCADGERARSDIPLPTARGGSPVQSNVASTANSDVTTSDGA